MVSDKDLHCMSAHTPPFVPLTLRSALPDTSPPHVFFLIAYLCVFCFLFIFSIAILLSFLTI